MADIRIKDLAAFSGTPTANDFLAIDGPNETKKIPANTFALDNKTKLNVTRLASGDDLDTLIGNVNSGFYYIESDVLNAPINFASLLVVAYNNTTIQIVSNQNGIWWRAYTYSPYRWSEWRSIQGETFQDKTYGDTYTIPSAGYLEIDDGADFQGKHILSILIFHWSANSGAFSVARGGGNRIYLIGDPGTTVRNLQLRILYQY